MPTERGVSLTELETIWLVRDFPPLFLFAQPDSWMAANWGQGSLAAAAESSALMPLTLYHFSLLPSPSSFSPSFTHTHTHAQGLLLTAETETCIFFRHRKSHTHFPFFPVFFSDSCLLVSRVRHWENDRDKTFPHFCVN